MSMFSKTIVAGMPAASLLLASAGYAEELAALTPDDLLFSVENMDRSIDPAVDFYRYAAGGWLDRVERPDHLSNYGMIAIMRERVKDQLIAAAEAASETDADKGTPHQLVGDFYAAIMDTKARDAAGLEPLRDFLDRISGIRTLDDLTRVSTEISRLGGPTLFAGFGPSPDLADPTRYVTYGYWGSFGIPPQHKDVLGEDLGSPRLEAYRTYLNEVLAVAGYAADDAARIADIAIDIETGLHAVLLTPVEVGNPRNMYNPLLTEEVRAQIPEMDLDLYFEAMELEIPDEIVLTEPRLLPHVSKILRERPIDELRDYAALRLILEFSDVLSTEFEGPKTALNAVMTGIAELPPRDERTIALMALALGHPLGKVYVDAYFDERVRDKAADMIARIKTVFLERIPTRDWISGDTRAAALEKLEKLSFKVGYPDEWIDFSDVDIGLDPVANAMNLAAFHETRLRERIGKAVQQDPFSLPSTLPFAVNAAYNTTINGFEVPAGIIQPPAFPDGMDAAVYFCRLGGIIGHEMTHGFDSGGRLFDAEGRLRDWWTPEDASAFDREAQKLIDQTDRFEVLPGLMGNGALNVKENMADVGGITLSHGALMHYLAEHPDEDVEIDGLTPSQRCFISWAQMWAWKANEQFIRSIVALDGHPPLQIRVTQPLRNLDAFHEAFGIEEGDPMWLAPEDRVNAW